MQGPVYIEKNVSKVLWEHSGPGNHASRLLPFKLFKHLRAFLEKNTQSALKDEKLSEMSAVQQYCFTASAVPLVFATLEDDTAYPVQIGRSALPRA